MHLKYTQRPKLICYEDFNREILAKPCFPTLTCYKILTKFNGWHLYTDNETYDSWIKIHTWLYIYASD